MEHLELFPVNVYKFKNENHEIEKPFWMEYLKDPKNFTNTRPGHSLHFTSPNLMKEPVFFNLVNWARSCFQQAYQDLGFVPSVQITSTWCTKHVEGGSHARHSHGNTFLAGVYYLSGNEKSSGTTWFNPNYKFHNFIRPAKLPKVPLKDNVVWHHSFLEGTLLIFPAWLEHYTEQNFMYRSKVERFIMGFNTLPLGQTNQDEFDRYFYYGADPEDMISNFSSVER